MKDKKIHISLLSLASSLRCNDKFIDVVTQLKVKGEVISFSGFSEFFGIIVQRQKRFENLRDHTEKAVVVYRRSLTCGRYFANFVILQPFHIFLKIHSNGS